MNNPLRQSDRGHIKSHDFIVPALPPRRSAKVRRSWRGRDKREERWTVGSVALSGLVVIAFIVTWELTRTIYHLENWLLPSPLDVLAAFGDPDVQSALISNTAATLEEALLGFGAALVVGTVLAIAMWYLPAVRRALYPLLVATQTIPLLVFAAVLIAIMGYDLTPRVIAVAFYAFFAVTVNVYDGLLAVDDEQAGMLATLGASESDIFRTARLPAALPGLCTGIKLAMTYSVAGAVYSEWIGSSRGLGFLIITSVNQFAEAEVFAAAIVVAAMGIICFGLVALLERLLVPWAR